MYVCTNCEWEGPKGDTLTPNRGDHRCPECIAEAVPEREVEDAEDDDEAEADDGFDWNPTMRAGVGGEEIEPGEDWKYRKKRNQRDRV